MATQQPRITVRRTVPFDLAGDQRGLRVTINDLRVDPDRVVLGLTGAEVSERYELEVGDRVLLGERPWTVEQITQGDRGSVVLVGAG